VKIDNQTKNQSLRAQWPRRNDRKPDVSSVAGDCRKGRKGCHSASVEGLARCFGNGKTGKKRKGEGRVFRATIILRGHARMCPARRPVGYNRGELWAGRGERGAKRGRSSMKVASEKKFSFFHISSTYNNASPQCRGRLRDQCLKNPLHGKFGKERGSLLTWTKKTGARRGKEKIFQKIQGPKQPGILGGNSLSWEGEKISLISVTNGDKV